MNILSVIRCKSSEMSCGIMRNIARQYVQQYAQQSYAGESPVSTRLPRLQRSPRQFGLRYISRFNEACVKSRAESVASAFEECRTDYKALIVSKNKIISTVCECNNGIENN